MEYICLKTENYLVNKNNINITMDQTALLCYINSKLNCLLSFIV